MFEDKAGTSLTGARARIWAPVGQIPVLTVLKGAQPRLSVAALCCHRQGEPPRMIYRTKPGWYRDHDRIALLEEAHRTLDAPVILVWDDLSGHRGHRIRRATATRAGPRHVQHRPALVDALKDRGYQLKCISIFTSEI